MNLIEHYIKEIHSVTDITEEFSKTCGYTPQEPLLSVDLTYDYYGLVKRKTETFWKSNFEEIKKNGYFLA